jgi:hypothetical protein
MEKKTDEKRRRSIRNARYATARPTTLLIAPSLCTSLFQKKRRRKSSSLEDVFYA